MTRAAHSRKTPRVLIVTPSPEEYGPLSSVLGASEGIVKWSTQNGPELVRVSAIGRGEFAAGHATQKLLEEIAPSLVILSGIAGARYDADVGPFDCISATSCLDYSIQEQLPGGGSRPTSRPVGSSFSEAEEFDNGLTVELSPLLLAAINSELQSLGAKQPSILPVVTKNITAKGRKLRRGIEEALEKHAARVERRFMPANVCSADDLHKDPDRLQSLTGHDKRLNIVEMEFANVLRACLKSPATPCIMVRAISDVVGYKKEATWTTHAAVVAACAVKALLLQDRFWAWIAEIDRSRRRGALTIISGDPGARLADDLSLLESLLPADQPSRPFEDKLGLKADQREQPPVLDPQSVKRAAEQVAKGLHDGYLPVARVSEALVDRTHVCSGCAWGARRGQLLRPVMEAIAQSPVAESEAQLQILANTARLKLLEGDYEGARNLLVQSRNAAVQDFLKTLAPDRLKAFLQVGLELYGVDSEDGELFWGLLAGELKRGTQEAATAARCLACKAVGAQDASAAALIELATSHAQALTDEPMRRDLHRAVETIALFHAVQEKTGGEWARLRGDQAFKRRLEAVRQLPDGRWRLRSAEAALLAALALVVSADPHEASVARGHLAALKFKGKATHCLFDIEALRAFVDSFEPPIAPSNDPSPPCQ